MLFGIWNKIVLHLIHPSLSITWIVGTTLKLCHAKQKWFSFYAVPQRIHRVALWLTKYHFTVWVFWPIFQGAMQTDKGNSVDFMELSVLATQKNISRWQFQKEKSLQLNNWDQRHWKRSCTSTKRVKDSNHWLPSSLWSPGIPYYLGMPILAQLLHSYTWANSLLLLLGQ